MIECEHVYNNRWSPLTRRYKEPRTTFPGDEEFQIVDQTGVFVRGAVVTYSFATGDFVNTGSYPGSEDEDTLRMLFYVLLHNLEQWSGTP